METGELKPIIEAMIFVAEEPLTETAILNALQDAGIEKSQVRECLSIIGNEWNEDSNRGLGLSEVAGGYQFRTKSQFAEWLRRLNIPKPMRLSGPALETLAIVAYRQPIVRSEVERIRGVDSGAVLKTLLDRHLLRIVGRQDEPGQPLLYGTTKEFLEIFNLKALGELPTLKDIEDLMRERRTITETKTPATTVTQTEDGEELTEVIEGEEESTEVIKKPSVEEEEKDEKDFEALAGLEQSLKDLRRLERSIFPKEVRDEMEAALGEGEDALPKTPEDRTSADGGGTDAPSPDDSSVE